MIVWLFGIGLVVGLFVVAEITNRAIIRWRHSNLAAVPSRCPTGHRLPEVEHLRARDGSEWWCEHCARWYQRTECR